METIQSACDFLEQFAPPGLAEDWDNVGLLLGDRTWPLRTIMTCLTVTPASVDEAIAQQASLIVSHHPLPFRPVKRLTSDTLTGRLLLRLATHQIAVYSPHTAFDSAMRGINQQLAEGIGLRQIRPLVAFAEESASLGVARWGRLDGRPSLADFAQLVGQFLNTHCLRVVGELARPLASAAVACGSAGQLVEAAIGAGCDALVLGETSFHTCLEAEAHGLALLLPGHYASERFAVDTLAALLAAEFAQIRVWASQNEKDPLTWLPVDSSRNDVPR
jgi:dinuclear metal center YbgI/SA1388 family protein